MLYKSENLSLQTVMEVKKGTINNIEICQDLYSQNYYTVLVIKDHETVQKIVLCLENNPAKNKGYVDFFGYNNSFLLVFRYYPERKLDDFFMGMVLSLEDCENICLNLIVQCMTAGLPYPLIMLILKQRQIMLLKDDSIRLGFAIDLTDLDIKVTEKDCAAVLATIVRDLLSVKMPKRNAGYKLLCKKIPRNAYNSFREIFKDIQLSASFMKKTSLKYRISNFFFQNGNKFFTVLLVVCTILLIMAIIALVSNAVWGYVPLFRILFGNFNQIGTEMLNKKP